MREYSADLMASGLKVCIVVSRFNDFLTKQLADGAVDCLLRHGVKDGDISVAWVPGANELPLAAAPLAKKGKVHAVIVLGAVVRGATSHADLINSQVSRALSDISLETGVPVINGVVAADSLEQAIERCGTKAGNKGWSAAQAAIEMANLYKEFSKGS